MPAHITHSQFNHPNQYHVISNSQTQQANQMNPSMQSGGHGGHHPAPSPVHTNPNQQNMNPGPHPPSSGTPQPPQGYPQATLQPPLQPSPHNNPTSPQNMQPMPYQYSGGAGHHPPVQMVQGSAGGGHQFSVQQQQHQSSGNVPTSVTYSMQQHHSPQLQQIVMMPPFSTASQMNQAHLHSHSQFHPGMSGKWRQSLVQYKLLIQPPIVSSKRKTPFFCPEWLVALVGWSHLWNTQLSKYCCKPFCT